MKEERRHNVFVRTAAKSCAVFLSVSKPLMSVACRVIYWHEKDNCHIDAPPDDGLLHLQGVHAGGMGVGRDQG